MRSVCPSYFPFRNGNRCVRPDLGSDLRFDDSGFLDELSAQCGEMILVQFEPTAGHGPEGGMGELESKKEDPVVQVHDEGANAVTYPRLLGHNARVETRASDHGGDHLGPRLPPARLPSILVTALRRAALLVCLMCLFVRRIW